MHTPIKQTNRLQDERTWGRHGLACAVNDSSALGKLIIDILLLENEDEDEDILLLWVTGLSGLLIRLCHCFCWFSLRFILLFHILVASIWFCTRILELLAACYNLHVRLLNINSIFELEHIINNCRLPLPFVSMRGCYQFH